MIRGSFVNALTSLVSFLRRGRKVVPLCRTPLKVNLGSGLAVTPGWVNIDGSLNALVASWPPMLHRVLYRFSGASQYYSLEDYCSLLSGHEFIHHDLSYGIPLPDACADFIYTSHFLEHLPLDDAARLLSESFRVLKPGGLMRVCVPDLAFAISLYSTGEKEKMLEGYFFVKDGWSSFARHKYMYDFELLTRALRAAGFAQVVRRVYREGESPDLQYLDRYPGETLFVETRKE